MGTLAWVALGAQGTTITAYAAWCLTRVRRRERDTLPLATAVPVVVGSIAAAALVAVAALLVVAALAHAAGLLRSVDAATLVCVAALVATPLPWVSIARSELHWRRHPPRRDRLGWGE